MLYFAKRIEVMLYKSGWSWKLEMINVRWSTTMMITTRRWTPCTAVLLLPRLKLQFLLIIYIKSNYLARHPQFHHSFMEEICQQVVLQCKWGQNWQCGAYYYCLVLLCFSEESENTTCGVNSNQQLLKLNDNKRIVRSLCIKSRNLFSQVI